MIINERRPVYYGKFLLRAFFAFWLITFFGCSKRQPARPTPQMDAPPQFWINVLLLDDVKNCTLTTVYPVTIGDRQIQIRFEQADIPMNIEASDGKIIIAGRPFTENELIISADSPYIFCLDGDCYRGKLKLIINPDGNSFDAVNLVPVEPYLAGVVGAEMPDYWEPTALEAQAIACRTYGLYIKKRFGGTRNWDVTKTQANQVYLGLAAESIHIWDAINKTTGKVLVCEQNGNEDIFPAYYSSNCGGHTENSEKVFGDFFGPLVGVTCPYCKKTAKPTFFFWPMVEFDKTYVTNKLVQNYPKLKELGKITGIISAGQSNYADFFRLTSIKLIGSTGKDDSLRAEDFRLTIDPSGRKIKSTVFQIADMGKKWAFLLGRGCGHAVGMCQCGAQAMARNGKTAEEILFYYYPGSKIIKIY